MSVERIKGMKWKIGFMFFILKMSNISVCNCSFLMSFINYDCIETLKEDRLVG